MKDWNRHNPIANFVRNRRKKSDLIQIELADMTGVGVHFVRELEPGKPLVRARLHRVPLHLIPN